MPICQFCLSAYWKQNYPLFAENSVPVFGPLILLLAKIGPILGGLVLDVVVMFIAGIVGLVTPVWLFYSGNCLGHYSGKIGEQNFAMHADGSL